MSNQDFYSYIETKRKYVIATRVYKQALVDLKAWDDKYGAEASAVVDDDECVVLTEPGHEGDARRERNQELLDAAVCVDCNNPDCGCAALAPKMA